MLPAALFLKLTNLIGLHHSSVAAAGAGPQALEIEGVKQFRFRFKVLSYVNCVHIGQHFKGDVFCEKYSHSVALAGAVPV